MYSPQENIYHQYNGLITSYVCKKVGHDNICYDIIQELYLKMLLQAGNLSNAKNKEAYITRMAGNAVNDYYRKQQADFNKDSDEHLIEDAQPVINDKSLLLADCCLLPMINSLPGIYRDALISIELNNMPQKEYSEKMGISLSAAKSRIQRAREKLKEIVTQNNYVFDRYGNIVACCK